MPLCFVCWSRWNASSDDPDFHACDCGQQVAGDDFAEMAPAEIARRREAWHSSDEYARLWDARARAGSEA